MKTQLRKCKNCENIFKYTTNQQRYCSICQYPKKNCLYCEKEFIFKINSKRKFCSSSCSTKFFRSEHSKKMKSMWADPNSKYNSIETRRKHSESLKLKYLNNPDYRFAVGKANRDKKFSKERKEKLSRARITSNFNNPQGVENRRQGIINSWKNPEIARKRMCRREPSVPEKDFLNICIQYNFPFQYVGNIRNRIINIDGKIPDFIHFSELKLIEIYGDFFHKGQNPQVRIDYFKQHGYDCIVFWASELKNKAEVINKVKNFLKSE